MSRSDETFETTAQCVAETTDAICVITEEDGDEQVWIPKSQIHDDSEVFEKGGSGKLIVTQWIAEKKGWV